MGLSGIFRRNFLCLLFLALSLTAWAIDPPLRDPSKLAKPADARMLRVATARVILADYDLLKKDFSELRDLSHDEIDRWILDQTGYVSGPQAAQTTVNTPIQTTGEERIAYRPKDYGRAVVFKAGKSGLIDAKGVGSGRPGQWDHGNGLASLGEAIREYAYEKAVSRVFQHSQTGLETVGTYAVVDYGFDVKNADGSLSPAGEVLRQAHERAGGTFSLFDEKGSVKVESVLRRYGITSAGAYHHEPFEKINIQGTRSGGVLDFGGFVVLDRFDKPARHFYGYRTLLDPGKPGFVQPDPLIRLPFEQWGHTVSGKIDPKLDNPWIWSHELADSLQKGTATRADAEQHLRNLLGPMESRLAAHPDCAGGALRMVVGE